MPRRTRLQLPIIGPSICISALAFFQSLEAALRTTYIYLPGTALARFVLVRAVSPSAARHERKVRLHGHGGGGGGVAAIGRYQRNIIRDVLIMNICFFFFSLDSHRPCFLLEMLKRNDVSLFFSLCESFFLPEKARGRNKQKRRRERERKENCLHVG